MVCLFAGEFLEFGWFNVAGRFLIMVETSWIRGERMTSKQA
jgi:hypothetical protein